MDAENRQSQLEQQTRELRQRTTATAQHVASIRLQYNDDLTVIESLTEYRRLQWRRTMEAGAAAAARIAGSFEAPSRTRSPPCTSTRAEGKGALPRQDADAMAGGGSEYKKGNTRRNGWVSGF